MQVTRTRGALSMPREGYLKQPGWRVELHEVTVVKNHYPVSMHDGVKPVGNR